MAIPLLYKKLIDLCRADTNLRNEVRRSEITSKAAATYRISQEDAKAALKELEDMRVIKPKNRLSLRVL
jgi:hypothetical protein